jgi:hypothetical protein
VFDTDSTPPAVEFAVGAMGSVIASIVSCGFRCRMIAPVQKDGVGWFFLMVRSARGRADVGEWVERGERGGRGEDEV